MKVALANDHAAIEAREAVIEELARLGIEVLDFGTPTPDRVDYPEVARQACEAVVAGKADRGIVICGTGIGISIAANKVKGIRCALCTDEYAAQMSREHNDANVIALRGREFDPIENQKIVRKWFETDFSHGERHQQRIDMISKIESGGCC